MFDKLEKVVARHSELADLLSKPEVTNDTNQYKKLTKEYADLQELVETFAEYKSTKKSVEENRQLFLDTTDAEMKEMAREEQEQLENKLAGIEAKLKELIVPKDPEDAKDAILESVQVQAVSRKMVYSRPTFTECIHVTLKQKDTKLQ